MAKDWAATFQTWSNPPSDTEEARCENAERMIREAISSDTVLSAKKIRVFTQGSYRHKTNVRAGSDVDIAVCLQDVYFSDYADFNQREIQAYKSSKGIIESAYTYKQFKDCIENALVGKFGRDGVTRGNKAIDVHANTYRVDADVVACFEHRRYTNIQGQGAYHEGTQFLPDKGGSVVNWPEQNHRNGIDKNKATSYRYKYFVRILKHLRNVMQTEQVAAASNVPSFLIESLLWNVPNAVFNSGGDYYSIMRGILAFLKQNVLTDEPCKEWGEVNQLKYLFRETQPWTRPQAYTFVASAWNYIGLG